MSSRTVTKINSKSLQETTFHWKLSIAEIFYFLTDKTSSIMRFMEQNSKWIQRV